MIWCCSETVIIFLKKFRSATDNASGLQFKLRHAAGPRTQIECLSESKPLLR